MKPWFIINAGPSNGEFTKRFGLFLLYCGNKGLNQSLALGACLHETVTGEPVSPRERSREIPDALESVILRCLQADPDRRYASARDLQRDLRRLAS